MFWKTTIWKCQKPVKTTKVVTERLKIWKAALNSYIFKPILFNQFIKHVWFGLILSENSHKVVAVANQRDTNSKLYLYLHLLFSQWFTLEEDMMHLFGLILPVYLH